MVSHDVFWYSHFAERSISLSAMLLEEALTKEGLHQGNYSAIVDNDKDVLMTMSLSAI